MPNRNLFSAYTTLLTPRQSPEQDELTPRSADLVSFVFGAAVIAGLGLDAGGYYSRTWGWSTLAVLVVAFAVLLLWRRLEVSAEGWWMLGALVALALLITLTGALASGEATDAALELERLLLYIAIVWAALVLTSGRSPASLVGGVLAGIVLVCVVGLGSYLFPSRLGAPDVFEGRHLFDPVGYSNAFGILMSIGVLLALGLAATPAALVLRAAAAGALVPLVTALALTSSRGAVVAAAVGLAITFGLTRNRRDLVGVAAVGFPLPLLSVAVALHSHVDDSQAPLTLVAHDGRTVAVTIVTLALASFAAASVALAGDRLGSFPRSTVIACLVLAVAAAAVAITTGFSGSAGYLPRYWHAAWLDVRDHPLLGSGAGSFAAAWLRYRTVSVSVQDAHNLYLETLAELGPIGLLLLVVALASPIRLALRSPRSPIVTSTIGAYIAFLAHAAVDWDWEMPVVTGAALLCAGSLLAFQKQALAPTTTAEVPAVILVGACIGSLAVAALSAAALVGNEHLHRAVKALEAGSWAKAQRQAHAAAHWQPWSAEPLDLLGQAELGAGQRTAATTAFQHALRLDSRRWQTWYELGSLAQGPQRQTAFEHILELNPLAVRTRGRRG
jgi:hypothetical protein